MKEILIVGTGALATLFAARLSAASVDVTMLGTWQAGLDALRKEGARLVGLDGVERAYPVRTTDDPADCRGARLALVLVKGWQTERAARQLYTCLAEEGLALTLQNGLGNREILVGALDLQRVALGVTTLGATLLAPGLARLGGDGPVSIEAHPRLGPLEAILRTAGFAVNVVEDARSLVWGKLVISAAINPLTALLRVTNGELLQRPAARSLMGELAREATAVARALGVGLPFEVPESAAEEVARRTSANRSSMLQDVLRGAPTEIDAICGAIVRAGEAAGLPTPVNRVMWQLVKALLDPLPVELSPAVSK
jgi:2-dehydropantoate 2-reductase